LTFAFKGISRILANKFCKLQINMESLPQSRVVFFLFSELCSWKELTLATLDRSWHFFELHILLTNLLHLTVCMRNIKDYYELILIIRIITTPSNTVLKFLFSFEHLSIIIAWLLHNFPSIYINIFIFNFIVLIDQ
jgi:hypothetical protein